MPQSHPAPLFSTSGHPYLRRPYQRRSVSTESDDELYVDRSLPATPTFDARPVPNSVEDAPGPSRAYRFALEDEEVVRHASEAFNDDEHPLEDFGAEAFWQDNEVEEEESVKAEEAEELREIRENEECPDIHVDRENAPGPNGGAAEEDEEEPPDERQCRICFSGQEEEDTLGRLISPCLCAGSMRYVHVQCINAWRGTGTNAKAFMECPQCKHRYQLRRTLISGLASSRPILLLLSTVLFVGLSILAGHILHSFLLTPEPVTSRSRSLLRTPRKSYTSSIFDIFQEDWDTFDNGVIIVGGGGGGPTLVWDVVMGSIQTFTDVANKLLLRREGFFANLGAPNWVGAIAFAMGVRFLLGLAVLGSLSFLSLLLSMSLFAPLQLANGLRGTGIFTRRRGNGNSGGTAAGQIMIVMFVLIGAANTLVKVYRFNEKITQKLLMYVETQILEVNPAERRGRRRESKWYVTWFKEGRWARRDGWEEVRVRLWMGARLGLGPVWERMWTGRGHHGGAVGIEG